jgi:molybdopterin-guanine dinucleotide biosynthesis protein A
MGRDKALLPIGGKFLLAHLVGLLDSVAPQVFVVAPSGRYEKLGFDIIEDQRSDCGPLAGIETALSITSLEWNLILACDLPNLDREWLLALCRAAHSASPTLQCIATGLSDAEPNPLLAIWHKSALPTVREFLDTGKFRVRSVLKSLETQILIPQDPRILANWNRPEDFSEESGEEKANRGC